MSELLTVSDLEIAKKHDTFHSEVITGKVGGVAGGADIETATNAVTGQVQVTLPEILIRIGPHYFGDFPNIGGQSVTLKNSTQCLVWQLADGGDGHYYAWAGAFPKIVAAGSTPTPLGAGGWIDRSDLTLRSELISGGMSVDDISKINTIVEDCTLNVPADYTDVNAAFNYLRTKNISPFATVVIKIADGNYVWNANQNCNHPNGDMVKVIGNQASPTNVTISTASAPTFDMFSCTDGNHLGLLDGVYITTPTKAPASNNFTAILADNSSSIKCGPKVKVNNWYYGIAARNGSFVYCRYADVSNSGDVGIWSFNGSAVDAQYAASSAAIDSANNWGWGFEAEYGSFLDCSYGSGTGCRRGGAGALSNSTVRALSFNGSSNIGSGLYVLSGGTIEAHSATLNNNTKYGYEQEQNGQIYGASITTTGNTIAPYSNYAYFDNSGVNGARIAANGSLRIDTNGANPIYFNTSGGAQFEVAHASSAVNHPYARGSSSGSAVEIGATGTDAVIDLALLPKGDGSYVKLGSGFVSSIDIPVTGYIYVKDNVGTVRKLAVVE